MPRRVVRSALALGAFALAPLLATPARAGAQAALGPGEDALTVPRGVVRVSTGLQYWRWNERYGPNGDLESLGTDLSVPSFDTLQLPTLTPVQRALRSLVGDESFRLSLGQTIVNSDVSVTVVPVVIEAGLASRFSIGVTVPYVRTRNDILFNVNPTPGAATVGFNPVLASDEARARNTQLVSELLGAAAQLETLAGGGTFCAANPANARCALAAGARDFAGGIATVYGTGSVATSAALSEQPGSPFVPLAGQSAQAAIEARVAQLKAQFGAVGNGITVTGPAAAPVPVTLGGAQQLFIDPAFGFDTDSLTTVERTHIGDLEVAAKLLWLDTFGRNRAAHLTPRGFNVRSALTGVFRFGTGKPDAANNFVDVGTGDGQNDVELQSATDLLFGGHFWTSVVARATMQLADEQVLRITDRPELVFAPAYRSRLVSRDLGDALELEVTPRWVLNDYFAFAGHYLFRAKQADEYSGRFTVDPSETGLDVPIELDASTLDAETERREHRVGFGLTFSTRNAASRGKGTIPLEFSYLHFQTIAGSGGRQPKFFSDQLQLRVYTRVFGGPAR